MSPVSTYASVLVAIALVAFLFEYLYTLRPDRFLRLCTCGWVFFALRILFLFIAVEANAPVWSQASASVCEILSAVFLLEGGWSFVGHRLPRFWLPSWLAYCVAIATFTCFGGSLFILGMLSHFPAGAMVIASGITFLQKKRISRVGRLAVGMCFFLWGLHKLDFPWLLTNPSWNLTGFWISGLLAALVGLGMVLVYYEDVRLSLQESEARFRTLVEHAPDAILVFDVDSGRFDEANASAERLFGRDLEELRRSDINRLYASDQPDRRGLGESTLEYQTRALAGETMQFERLIQRANGEIVHCEVCLVRLPARDRHLLRASYIDITARKRAEAQVQRDLQEKEILLRELHHRTKNNMAMITALLGLQSNSTDDERVKAAFDEMENRIQSMALVHELFYAAKDLSSISLKSYLSDLLQHLTVSFGASHGRISLVSRMVDIFVSIETALPCGLILNELITNAFKYAFPGGRRGEITVSLNRRKSGEILLEVVDDGIGIVPGFDARRDGGIGFQIVFALAESQLRARVELRSEHGVTWLVAFDDFVSK
jgi:PAS domain S-box-containing protein